MCVGLCVHIKAKKESKDKESKDKDQGRENRLVGLMYVCICIGEEGE